MKTRGQKLIMMILCVVLLGAHAQAFFMNGKVTAVDSAYIVLNGVTYQFALTHKVVVQTERNGAYFEDNGSLRDIREGSSVTVHVNGNVVDHVTVERWRQ